MSAHFCLNPSACSLRNGVSPQKWCGLLCLKLCGISSENAHPEGCYPRSILTNGLLLRKEVIQPLVPQRLPCYDFIPVIYHTLGAFLLVKGWINDFGCNKLP